MAVNLFTWVILLLHPAEMVRCHVELYLSTGLFDIVSPTALCDAWYHLPVVVIP